MLDGRVNWIAEYALQTIMAEGFENKETIRIKSLRSMYQALLRTSEGHAYGVKVLASFFKIHVEVSFKSSIEFGACR